MVEFLPTATDDLPLSLATVFDKPAIKTKTPGEQGLFDVVDSFLNKGLNVYKDLILIEEGREALHEAREARRNEAVIGGVEVYKKANGDFRSMFNYTLSPGQNLFVIGGIGILVVALLLAKK